MMLNITQYKHSRGEIPLLFKEGDLNEKEVKIDKMCRW